MPKQLTIEKIEKFLKDQNVETDTMVLTGEDGKKYSDYSSGIFNCWYEMGNVWNLSIYNK